MNAPMPESMRWEQIARRAWFLLCQPDTTQAELDDLMDMIPACRDCGERFEVLNSRGYCVSCSRQDVQATMTEVNRLLIEAVAALNDEREGDFNRLLSEANAMLNDTTLLAARW